MRVRLTYSVELDDVPSEVSDLIEKRIKVLHDAADLVEDVIVRLREADSDIQMVAVAVDRAREKIAKFDLTLQDAHGILEGLIEAQEPQAPTPPSGPIEAQPSPWPPEDLDV